MVKFTKKSLGMEELLENIKMKGFMIKYDSVVEDFILNNGYSHIVPYIKCFTIKTEEGSRTLIENQNFDDVIRLFNLDINLQNILLGALKQIEVFLKAYFTKYTLDTYGDPLWHIKEENIQSNREDWIEIFNEIQKDRSESEVMKNFVAKYPEEKYLPIWTLIEITSFGPFTKLFSYLSPYLLKQFCILLNVDSYYKGQKLQYDFTQLKWWLRGFAKLRNRIAHSEMTRSKAQLPLITLPNIGKQLNTTCSYIQLIEHVLNIIPNTDANGFFRACYDIFKEIDNIEGIVDYEKHRIGLTGNWEIRFKKILS